MTIQQRLNTMATIDVIGMGSDALDVLIGLDIGQTRLRSLSVEYAEGDSAASLRKTADIVLSKIVELYNR